MKKQRLVIALLLVMCFFFSFSLSSSADNGDTIVYITRTGECYHNSGCSYLKSKIEVTLSEAVNGGYRPCSRCHPPVLDESMPNLKAIPIPSFKPVPTVNPGYSSSRYNTSTRSANYSSVSRPSKNSPSLAGTMLKVAGFCAVAVFICGRGVRQSEERRQAQERARTAANAAAHNYYPPVDRQSSPQVRFQPTQTTITSRTVTPLRQTQPSQVTVTCPRCGAKMVLRNGQYGFFYGCPNFPRCKGTRSYRQ